MPFQMLILGKESITSRYCDFQNYPFLFCSIVQFVFVFKSNDDGHQSGVIEVCIVIETLIEVAIEILIANLQFNLCNNNQPNSVQLPIFKCTGIFRKALCHTLTYILSDIRYPSQLDPQSIGYPSKLVQNYHKLIKCLRHLSNLSCDVYLSSLGSLSLRNSKHPLAFC